MYETNNKFRRNSQDSKVSSINGKNKYNPIKKLGYIYYFIKIFSISSASSSFITVHKLFYAKQNLNVSISDESLKRSVCRV